jgi:hypothetical protein
VKPAKGNAGILRTISKLRKMSEKSMESSQTNAFSAVTEKSIVNTRNNMEFQWERLAYAFLSLFLFVKILD